MRVFRQNQKRIYLDYAAATPVRKEVQRVMRPFERNLFANPSAIHTQGVLARNAVEHARTTLARLLKVRPTGIVFTASGTESNNNALIGVITARHAQGVAYTDMEVISTQMEHPSVMKTLQHLEGLGVTIRFLKVDTQGHIVTKSLSEALTQKAVLLCFSYANSEVGVVQEVGKIARIVRAFEKEARTKISIHLDAAQAPLWLPCQLERLGVDTMTLDASKCYGPKGVGVLVMRHGVDIAPVLYGGPQEQGIRPGTENVAGIVGAVEALVYAQKDMHSRVAQVVSLRDNTIKKLLTIEGVILNGAVSERIANNINISIPDIDSEFAVVSLDIAGVACSTKSACSGASSAGSSVVYAMTGDARRAGATIRLSLGEDTTAKELDRVVLLIRQHVERMRSVQKLTKS